MILMAPLHLLFVFSVSPGKSVGFATTQSASNVSPRQSYGHRITHGEPSS